MKAWEIPREKDIKNDNSSKRTFLKPLLASDKLAYTIPEKPQSRLQKYVTKR